MNFERGNLVHSLIDISIIFGRHTISGQDSVLRARVVALPCIILELSPLIEVTASTQPDQYLYIFILDNDGII